MRGEDFGTMRLCGVGHDEHQVGVYGTDTTMINSPSP